MTHHKYKAALGCESVFDKDCPSFSSAHRLTESSLQIGLFFVVTPTRSSLAVQVWLAA